MPLGARHKPRPTSVWQVAGVADEDNEQEDKCGWDQMRGPLYTESCGEGCPKSPQYFPEGHTGPPKLGILVGIHPVLVIAA